MTAMFIIALFPVTVLSTQYFANVSQFGPWASTLAVSVICIGAMAGGLGGVIVQKIAGNLTDTFKENPHHVYRVSLLFNRLSIMKILVRRHKPISEL